MNNYISNRRIQGHVNQTSYLGRDELKRRIMNFRGRFKLDFTEDYLNKISVERLRHILLVAQINAESKSRRLESKIN